MTTVNRRTSMMQFHELRGGNVELLIGRVPTALMEDDLTLENLFKECLVASLGVAAQRTISVAFGAKRTLSRIYEYTA
jgi:hypothetical protein